MKIQKFRVKTTKISHSRWLAYATASAATAITGSNSLEAAIHDSGTLHVPFPPEGQTVEGFQLDQQRDFFVLSRRSRGSDLFRVGGIAGYGFRGYASGDRYFVSRLNLGDNISAGRFASDSQINYMVTQSGFGPWADRGESFIGFRFNNGAGFQYGWARIRMTGDPQNHAFRLVDYAYADPGEPIKAGQYHNSSGEPAPDQGSLGWLAAGAVGVLAWRKRRSLVARSE